MKKVKRTNVLVEKKRYKMFKSKKKWLIAPLSSLASGWEQPSNQTKLKLMFKRPAVPSILKRLHRELVAAKVAPVAALPQLHKAAQLVLVKVK